MTVVPDGAERYLSKDPFGPDEGGEGRAKQPNEGATTAGHR